jgi:hypothetical protein
MEAAMRWGISVLALAMCVSVVGDCAFAQQVITRCGKASGKSYDLDKNEWTEDNGAMNQMTTVVRDTNGDYDVLYKDAFNSGSVHGDGAKVFKVEGDDELLTLVAVYPQRVIEVYQLTLDAGGRGGLIWSSFKNRAGSLGPVTIGTLLAAQCSR